MNESVVFDADGHICEPEMVWTEYTREAFRDRVLQVRTEAGQSFIALEGRDRRGQRPGPANACIPGGMAPDTHPTWADILPGSWDPAERLKVMAEEGIHRALFFPSIYLLWGDVQDPEVAAEVCRAYNDWMSDFCRQDPERLFGMAIVPFQDTALALAEVKRLRGLGLSGFISRPERFRGLALYDEQCDPIWQAAVDDGLAFAIHGSFGSRMPGFATGRYEDNIFCEHMIAHPFGQMAVMMDLIAGGPGPVSRSPGGLLRKRPGMDSLLAGSSRRALRDHGSPHTLAGNPAQRDLLPAVLRLHGSR